MPYIFFPKSGSVSFVTNTDDGIGASMPTVDANYLYEDSSEFFNCNLKAWDKACQMFQNGDIIKFQFRYKHASNATPVVVLEDADGNYHSQFTISETEVFADYTVYFVSLDVDFGTSACDCYYAKVYSYSPNAALSICGDNGTFEAAPAGWGITTGGNNVTGQSNTEFYAGANSLIVLGNVAPSAGSEMIFECNATNNFLADTLYKITGYIRDDESTPFTQDGDSVYWDVLTELTDANIIYEIKPIPSVDGRDEWHEVTAIFRTGADVTAKQLRLMTESLPQNGGIYVDAVTVEQLVYTVEQATSQRICICDEHKCTIAFEASGKDDQMELRYLADDTQFIRFECNWRELKFQNDDHTTSDNTGGETEIRTSIPKKVYRFKTGLLPFYQAEKIALMLGMDYNYVYVNSVQKLRLTCISKSPEIKSEPYGGKDDLLFKMEFDMMVTNYPYQNTNCS